MKLLVVSDLHLEFGNTYSPPASGYDVAIIAGDIAVPAARAVHWARRASTFPCAKAVIFVAGNHEFYGSAMQPALAAMQDAAKGSQVHALDCAEVIVDGVRFLGATLWTDFALPIDSPSGAYSHVPLALSKAKKSLSDFQTIRTKGTAQPIVDDDEGSTPTTPTAPVTQVTQVTPVTPVTLDFGTERGARLLAPEDTLALHLAHRDWLACRLAEPFDGKTVVVTHHAPHRNSLAAQYADDWLSPAFVSELPAEFFEIPELWIHGHTHASFDYWVGKCRVVCNPRGYLLGRMRDRPENPQFNPSLVIEI